MSVNRIEVEENGTEIVQPKNNLESQTSTKTTEQQGNALSSWHYISWIFGIILTLGTISVITLIPSKNILIEPEYWYESVILVPTLGWIPLFVTALIFQLEFLSNITYTKSISTWIYMFVIGALTYTFLLLNYHYLWTRILGFYQPAPFSGYLCGSQMIFTLFAATWFRMPKHARMDPKFKKRYMYFIISQIISIQAGFSYIMFGYGMIKIKPEYQWILGLSSGIMREFFVFFIQKTSLKSLGDISDKDIINRSKLSSTHLIETAHALQLAIVLASVATPITTYTILGMDFLINISHGLHIVYQLKENKKDEAQEGLEKLWLSERIETVIPFVYACIFLMAYYGPNAKILGGIKLDLWHHEAVTDIIPVVKNLLLLFCIDLLSAITNGILLAITCKINSFKWIQKIQSQYWLIFAFTEARCMFEIFLQTTIGQGTDYSFGFDWINGKYLNSTHFDLK